MRFFRSLSIGCLFFLWHQNAHSFDFTEFGSFNFSAPTQEKYSNISRAPAAGIAWGAGFGLGFQLRKSLFFEVSLVYAQRGTSQYRVTLLQLPCLVRYWFMESLSFGIGPYFAHAIGNIVSKDSILGFDQVGWQRDEMGVTLSIRYKTPVNSFLSVMLDERLNIELSQLYEWQSWLGLSLLI